MKQGKWEYIPGYEGYYHVSNFGSIVVSCLYHIFRTILPNQPENNNQTNAQLNLFDNMD